MTSRRSKRKVEESSESGVDSLHGTESKVTTGPKLVKQTDLDTPTTAAPAEHSDSAPSGTGSPCISISQSHKDKIQAYTAAPSLSVDGVSLQPGKDPSKAVNIAVSSSTLFDTGIGYDWKTEPNFTQYLEKITKDETTAFPPGPAFKFIQALSNVNRGLMLIDPNEQERFNVILMSHNHAHVGVKLITSINHHGLYIERMCLTGGSSPVPHYLQAYNVALFLTSYAEEVEKALESGYAAAAMTTQSVKDCTDKELRVAFDLDAVLFSPESEVHYKEGGLKAFFKHERANVHKLVDEGPLKKFAQSLGRMQQKFESNKDIVKESPIKVYIVTARSAASSGERAIKTLRAWGIHINEIHFLAGAPKGPILNAIKPHIFFDDQQSHIDSAQEYGISAAQVPNTVDRQLKHDQSVKDLAAFSQVSSHD